MRRAFAVAVVLAAVVALVGVGTAGADARDVARVTGVRTSGAPVHVGDVFTIDAAARDRGANDYSVGFSEIPAEATLVDQTCRGTQPNSPSPDLPDCEYDSNTTTTSTTTHTVGSFLVNATPTERIRIKVCAQSLSGSQAKPDCRRVTIRAIEDRARLVDVRLSARTVHVGGTFTIDAAARDRGSNDYFVEFSTVPAGVTLVHETCRGTHPDSPSADMPACEYDPFTTTLSTTTHTVGFFQADASAADPIRIQVCAQPMTFVPPPDCRTVTVRIR